MLIASVISAVIISIAKFPVRCRSERSQCVLDLAFLRGIKDATLGVGASGGLGASEGVGATAFPRQLVLLKKIIVLECFAPETNATRRSRFIASKRKIIKTDPLPILPAPILPELRANQRGNPVLASFSLSNFKSFRKLDPIELRPLTVLCGINNSGKSTLLQSLLLMKQSNIAFRGRSLRADLQEPLLLNGPYVSLGDWADVISGHATEEEMGFSWKLSGGLFDKNTWKYKMADAIEISVIINSFKSENNQDRLQVKDFVCRDLRSKVGWEISSSGEDQYLLKLEGISLGYLWWAWMDPIMRYLFKGLKYDNKKLRKELLDNRQFWETQLFLNEVFFQDVEIDFEGIWPSVVVFNEFPKQVRQALSKVREELTRREQRVPECIYQFLDSSMEYLEGYLKDPAADEFPSFWQEKDFSLMSQGYQSYKRTFDLIWDLLWNIRYLGPVREAPHRYYLLNDISGIEMGNKGEGIPLVLGIERDEIVASYYRCIYKGKQVSEYELRESDSLLDAVNWWLSEGMKLPKISDPGGSRGVPQQVKLESSGLEVSLPDVGFGISQVLPVLVECLRSQPGDTIILEQPEIHLHPSLQSRLADFLICMAKSDKKLVIETHSEYMMNRFFLRIAQEDDDEIRKLFNPLFVSFDEGEQTSVVKPISINEFGEIENWPVGFFDQNDARELMAATLKKRTSKSKR